MISLSVNQPLVQLSGTANQIVITVPITCRETTATGVPVTATIRLYIFEGSTNPGHGDLLATYDQSDIQFSPGQTKNVAFTHTETQRSQSRRDVGVEVVVGGKVVSSREFDDAYTWPLGGGFDLTQMIGMIMMVVMLGMVTPMLGNEEM